MVEVEDKVLVWVVAEALAKEEAVGWEVQAVEAAMDWGQAATVFVFNAEKRHHTRGVFLATSRDVRPVGDL